MSHNLAELTDSVIKAAKAAGADQADSIAINSLDLSTSCRHGKMEELERSESCGVGLRVWVGKRSANTSGSDLSSEGLKLMAERAVDMARVATEDPYSALAAKELLVEKIPDLELFDASNPSEEALYKQAELAEKTALDTEGITNSEGADAYFGTHEIALATSDGFAGGYHVSSASLSLSVLAGQGDKMERDYDYATRRYAANLPEPAKIGATAAKRALRRLNPRKVKTCQVPLVFEPRIGKSLLSYFASAINGSSVARGTSFLKDQMGGQLFAEGITIMDDPLRKRGLASRPFDGEGVTTRKQALIEDGVLQTWLLDTRSAAQLGLTTTGHASRGMGNPSPSATNLYMEAGDVSPEAMIGDIKNGFYVTESFGMGVNLVTGDYSQGASGFWIENGEITYPVSELTIAGHLSDMFKRLTPANDLEFNYGTNVPTLRIDGMTVAGN